MKNIGVVYLLRSVNEFEAFDNFFKSYLNHPAGIDHDLIIIFKGFSKKYSQEYDYYHEKLKSYKHYSFFMKDFGYDIGSYLLLSKHHIYPYYCFLNSYSTILDDLWLQKMYDLFMQSNIVGLVGCTGSYQSLYYDIVRKQKMIRYLEPWQRFRRSLNIKKYLGLLKRKLYFHSFPNPHIRTNGFMISRGTLNQIVSRPIRTKMDAYRFESGKLSLTNQIKKLGLQTIVVGRNGQGYDIEHWQNSNTFWIYDQENLLVADNQTRAYTHGDNTKKLFLSTVAWSTDYIPWSYL